MVLIGLVTLSVTVLWLYIFTFYEAWVLHAPAGILVGLALPGLAITILQEYRAVPTCSREYTFLSKENALNFVAVVVGALATYVISVDLSLGAVTASGLVGLLAGLIVPAYGVPAYCGSFVGMSSAQLLVNHTELGIAAMVAGVIYMLTTHTCAGIGGKLGTIAFAAAVLTGLSLQRAFLITPVPTWDIAWQIVLYAVLAAVITFWLSVYLKHGAVIASSVVGLVGGLLLPALYPDPLGNTLAVVVICASFTGMASPQRIPKLWHMAVAGLVTGVIFVYSMPILGGAGGKLGTIAFGAVMVVYGYMQLFERHAHKVSAARSSQGNAAR